MTSENTFHLDVSKRCEGGACNCDSTGKFIAKKVDSPESVRGFVALVHELTGDTFTLKRYMRNGEQLATKYDIPGVKSVAVYYWEKDETYDKPLLLEVTLGVGGKKYYYRYSECEPRVTNQKIWQHITSLTLQVMLDDRNCGRNGAIVFNLQNPTSGNITGSANSHCTRETRKIKLDGLKLLAGSEYVTTTYSVNGKETKISRVTLNDKSTGIPPITEAIEKIILYSYISSPKVPLMIEFKQRGGRNSKFYTTKDSSGTNWEETGDGGNAFYDSYGYTPLPTLSEKLDEVLCKRYSYVTLNLTKNYSETHASGGSSDKKYCCSEHKDKGKISVAKGYIMVDGRQKISYYQHNNNGYSLGGIYYKDGNDNRKRIVLSTQNFPIKGSLTVSAFYCTGDIPVLIYVDSSQYDVKGWFKKNKDDNQPWTKLIGVLPSVTPASTQDCPSWNKLVNALRSAGCYNYSTCAAGTTQLPGEKGSADSIIPGPQYPVGSPSLAAPEDHPEATHTDPKTARMEAPGPPDDSPGNSTRDIGIFGTLATAISGLVGFAGYRFYKSHRGDPWVRQI
ncbi:hypothetical protein BEWA_004250 [Theileria equi strain WA]|uniref:Uncharacterized protein n=1 Tax=Theileria equi strain WA TaxID=1537102 RepID=L0AZJ7_THEEQ|nr:hypothetical protein BEWA_004250 [Theileria equi strain WA]AFZ81017.1 hypothetical protein BEWA_004250 [Theileria equi strain WA]|eukprot:XP_004830683.1 hypothetical protein BEWA_004250 [Theileria equi strain WA]